ncbi:TRAP transporter small permease subunit [Hyphomicrobiales bacterium]|jgi:TRAP-type mannitol/chloroaromatic compound transport system permease small subunit|nr:TRAP transporter small permease subunit [Hyphomicrobiales bacterium]MDA9905200.1 TRAP transporter small permease subunit [Hyphomicrobiales bacterium]|tara:strand:+ start:865 stop:1380 length:516 start_codon:yes stop_codon:yes gene_type:complete
MFFLIKISSLFDKINEFVGKNISWFIILMVIVQLAIVMSRYIYGIGFLKLQELLIYLHGSLFTLAAGYTLLKDEHVRVDLIYREASQKYKSLINIFGSLIFLIPFCLLTFSTSLPYVRRSWKILEGSPETSGLNAVFILKTVLIIFPILLLLQSFSIIIRSSVSLIRKEND